MAINSMRQIIIACLGLCSSVAYTQTQDPKSSKEEKLSLEKRLDLSTEKKASGAWGGINPSARGCPPSSGFSFSADFLWWRAENQGFTYAAQTSDGFSDGRMIRVHPNWDPGFRVTSGWNTQFDSWDLIWIWTWYQNQSHSKNAVDLPHGADGGFVPLFPVSHAVNENYRNADGNYRLLHNIIDMELGRAHYITKALSLRPHWGLRGASLNQKFHDSFSGSLNDVAEYKRFRGKNKYWGIGPRVGTHAHYHLGWGFSVLGQASASALYGHTNVSFRSELFEPTEDTNFVTDREYKDEFDQLVPNFQLMLGVDWSSCFRNETMFFGVSVGWESNYWWNQFNLPVVLLGSANSVSAIAPLPNIGNQPVTMEGITMNVRLDF